MTKIKIEGERWESSQDSSLPTAFPEVARGVGDGVMSKTLEATIVLHVVCIDNACSAIALPSEINCEVSWTTGLFAVTDKSAERLGVETGAPQCQTEQSKLGRIFRDGVAILKVPMYDRGTRGNLHADTWNSPSCSYVIVVLLTLSCLA